MGTAADHFTTTQARLLQETGTPVSSRFLTIQAPAARVQQVHVLEGGRDGAPPVLLLHGGNSVAAAWEPLLSLLQGDFRLFAPDRPGCGLTDMLDYHGVPFREHAVAFVGGVLDALGLPRASLWATRWVAIGPCSSRSRILNAWSDWRWWESLLGARIARACVIGS